MAPRPTARSGAVEKKIVHRTIVTVPIKKIDEKYFSLDATGHRAVLT
jgi:hypothetical protein